MLEKKKVPENLATSIPTPSGNPLVCSETRFKCRNGHCVDRSFLCNGQDNCQDNSDEELCLTTAGESLISNKNNSTIVAGSASSGFPAAGQPQLLIIRAAGWWIVIINLVERWQRERWNLFAIIMFSYLHESFTVISHSVSNFLSIMLQILVF